MLGEVKALRADLADRDYRDTMERDVIPLIKGDFELPDDYVEHWVNKQADETLLQLWEQRKQKPAQFQEAMEALRPRFEEHVEKQFGQKPGEEDPSRRIASVVKGSRVTEAQGSDQFDNVDWSGLSEQDLEIKKRLVFKAAESGKL